MSNVRIKVKRPFIAYPGSTLQQNYAEDTKHGYLLWDISGPKSYDVRFHELPNPIPFVTIDWMGDVDKTLVEAKKYPRSSRFRVYSHIALVQKDAVSIVSELKQQMNATEVTFKTDQHVNMSVISAGSMTVIKDDLRNPDVLLKLLKDYHNNPAVSEKEWENVYELLKTYLSQASDSEGSPRNTKWSLKHLSFDNTFAYGTGNIINFDAILGVCGIFGANALGKSSIVGSIMYALFNTTDRGSMKNIHVPNIRKPFCYTKAIIDVNGTNYVIERQTTKHENKRGYVNASTALNVFRVDGTEATDLAGEQRTDSEKVIRSLIGTADDFLMTSASTQDDMKMFINQGSSRRRQVLSRFLDLDVFDRMYVLGKDDLNSCKAVLRNLPDRDWSTLADANAEKLDRCAALTAEKEHMLLEAHSQVHALRDKLASFKGFTAVTKMQVDSQRQRSLLLTSQAAKKQQLLSDNAVEQRRISTKISSIEAATKDQNVGELKQRLEAYRALEGSVNDLRHIHEKESTTLKQQERSLKILDDVPCGDDYPSCKFIKDAHVNKGKLSAQRERVDKTLAKLTKADDALAILKQENIQDRVSKIEALLDALGKLNLDASSKQLEEQKLKVHVDELNEQLLVADQRLEELETALKNDENVEVVSLRSELDRALSDVKRLDAERLQLASEVGKVSADREKYDDEREQRSALFQKMRAYELVVSAFSRKGVPHVIVTSQLPQINAEIAKILHGIVGFTVELVADDDTDTIEVYIDYGDSRRIIELGSGMEKMIASMAIRAALINVSSLPKTDMFIIDEGFGALDDTGVEACNRLLVSLKRYFKTIITITHVDGVKDTADVILEITRNEKDAKVVFE